MQGQCPHCDEMYEIDDRAIGSKIACPACQTMIEVPSPAAQIRQYREVAKEKKKIATASIIGFLVAVAIIGVGAILHEAGNEIGSGVMKAGFLVMVGVIAQMVTMAFRQDI